MIQTSDYAPVVRCKDCRWWDKEQSADGFNGFCVNTGMCSAPDWFCADGERRDSNEKGDD